MHGSIARAPRNVRSQQPQFRLPAPTFPTGAQIGAAQRDFARRTPGEAGGIGASQGGTGLTPAGEWSARFPNSPTADALRAAKANPAATEIQGPSITGAPLSTAATPRRTGNAVPSGAIANAPANVNSSAVQNALDRNVAPTGNVTATPTGNKLTSQFGDGSSRQAAPGEPLNPATTTANGVSRVPGWQTQVMQAHPEIAQAGSEGNQAYVAAHKAKTATGQPFDPVQLAHDTMNLIYSQRQAGADEENAMAKDAQTKSDSALAATRAKAATDAATAREDAGRTFTKNTPLGNAEDAAGTIGDIPGAVKGAVKDVASNVLTGLGVKQDTADSIVSSGANAAKNIVSQGANALDALTGGGKIAAAKAASNYLFEPPSLPGNSAPDESSLRQVAGNAVMGGPPVPVPDNSAQVEKEARQSAFESQWHAPTQEPPQATTDNSTPSSDRPSLAGGLMPGRAPQFKFPAVNAMAREKMAIHRGTGGAQPGDKPVPINLPGVGPAVVNTGEKIMATPAGPAVLNRDQQRVPNHAMGGPMIQPSHRGLLHKDLGVPAGQKIPAEKIAQARNSSSPGIRKRAVFAANARQWKMR